jgi:hypothetical protein
MDYIVNKYLFIGGTGRSGTNIVRKIFSRHPLVGSIPFEYRFIIDPDGVVDFYQSITNTWSPYMADVKIKRLQSFLENLAHKSLDKKNYKDWELAKWFPNYNDSISDLINKLKSFEYQGYWPGAIGEKTSYRIYFSEYKEKEILCVILGEFIQKNINDFLKDNEKRFFVEDNTWNILFANELADILPQSKLVHLVRDPRDVIASFMGQRWCPNNFTQALNMYKSIINRWFEIEEQLPVDFYKIIKLEELVKNPQKIIKEICCFSGIPYNTELLKTKLDKSNEGRWKKIFTKQNEETIKVELKNVFERLSYHG